MSWKGTLIKAGISEHLNVYTKEVTLADDGTHNLPDKKDGFVLVSSPAEAMLAQVNADGSVVKIGGSTNTAATDSDTDLCVYDGGTYGIVKNRLGSSKAIKVMFLYFD